MKIHEALELRKVVSDLLIGGTTTISGNDVLISIPDDESPLWNKINSLHGWRLINKVNGMFIFSAPLYEYSWEQIQDMPLGGYALTMWKRDKEWWARVENVETHMRWAANSDLLPTAAWSAYLAMWGEDHA